MNPTRCGRLAIAVFGGLLALDRAAGGQTVDFLVQEGAVGPVVRDAPYSAESVTTFTQTLGDGTRIERQLTGMPNVGPADYADEGMLQYLKAERVVPPYQTRGHKVVELVRIYRLIA